MDIIIRLNILKEAGQISEITYEQVNMIIKYFKDNHNIEITEENGAMIITHLCIALNRIEKGENINGIEEEIYKDVRMNKHYDKAEKIMDDIDQILGSAMPMEEKGYMMMHLCVLLETATRE